MATRTWQEAFFPSDGGGAASHQGYFVATVYGKQGADNEQLFQDVWRAAARRGSAPYFICMDAQINETDSPFLSWVVDEADWHDLSAGTAEEASPTYGRSPDWDRKSWGQHTTRIDYIFANNLGRAIVVGFELLRDVPCV